MTMKKLVLAIMIATMAFSGTALAQDNVGVYFDAAGTQMYTGVTEITVLRAYCIASDLTATAIGGFELQLLADGPLSLANFEYQAEAGAINVQQPPTFMVGFAGPQPLTNGAYTLFEFDVLVYSANTANWPFYAYNSYDDNDDAYEAHITVQNIFFQSIEDDLPAYLDEAGVILPLYPATNNYRGGTYSVIEGVFGPVATDDASWDGVKSLFR